MDTTLFAPPEGRTRRRHSAEFKARVVSACLQPGVSIAAVALANQLNANLVRCWVKAHRDQQRASAPASAGSDLQPGTEGCPLPKLVPVAVQVSSAQPARTIQLEIHHQHTVVHIRWPTSEAATCAQWLRELLR